MASNYGWAKHDILNGVYLDELFVFSRLITRRKISEQKMALAIATNPHTKNAKRLWDELDRQERYNDGRDYLDAEFDAIGFDRFKQALQRHGSSIVVK